MARLWEEREAQTLRVNLILCCYVVHISMTYDEREKGNKSR
jgi:hypothetical protein